MHLTPWTTAFLEKLIIIYVVKKCPAFYGKKGFITGAIETHEKSLS
jgi:hypothetical protein